MKNIQFIMGLFVAILVTSCGEPDAEVILKRSFEKCQSIDWGYYEMIQHKKYASSSDTSAIHLQCYFEKRSSDTLYSFAFHWKQQSDDGYKREALYSGDEFVEYSTTDSSGEIMSTALWADDIAGYSHNYTFYDPITSPRSFPLPHDSMFLDKKRSFEFLGEEIVGKYNCYHVRMSVAPTNDSSDVIELLRQDLHYWIDKQDDIPVQYTRAIDIVLNSDTMHQFERNVLTKHDLNGAQQPEQIKWTSIPPYIQLSDYQPSIAPELLAENTVAPSWSLPSLDDETISLADLKGQLVLVDFFYKSCAPCMLALPALQGLHERYKDKGIQIVGINPYDTKEEDDIDNFLAGRGVTYTVLLGGRSVASEYHVSGYPTVYLIGKDGKILFSKVGYGEGSEAELEELIKQNL